MIPFTERAALLAAYQQARRRHFDTRADLERWQARQVRRALERARRRFPYYRSVAHARLDAFPVMDKATFTEHFEALNDRGLELAACLERARAAEADRDFTASLAGVSIGLSSGTSGRQSVFLTSPAERRRWAASVLAKGLPGGLRAGARIALVLRAGGPLYESVSAGRVVFQFFDLAQPMDEHLRGLVDLRPTVLAAPPQALILLAKARRDGRLPVTPKRIFSIAEVLDPHDQAIIEAAFGLRVDQIYQATEGFLGISCMRGRLHLNEDVLHIERQVLDEGGRRFVPVVTDLFRRTQAIVRFRLDDVLIEAAEPCPCGSPCRVIERVEGRCDDVLLLAPASGGALRPLFPDFVRGAVLAVQDVTDVRVVQEAPDLLRLAVLPAQAWPGAAAALHDLATRSGLRVPRIERAAFEVQPSVVKLRRVRRTFPGDAWPTQATP
jgi:putative adenylate-forming enzyme